MKKCSVKSEGRSVQNEKHISTQNRKTKTSTWWAVVHVTQWPCDFTDQLKTLYLSRTSSAVSAPYFCLFKQSKKQQNIYRPHVMKCTISLPSFPWNFLLYLFLIHLHLLYCCHVRQGYFGTIRFFQFPAFWEVTGFYLKYLGNLMTSFNNEVAMLHYNCDDSFPFDDDNQGQFALMCTWALIMNNYTWSFRLWLAFPRLALRPGSHRRRRPPERAGGVSSSFL